jgi:hypothetical protein
MSQDEESEASSTTSIPSAEFEKQDLRSSRSAMSSVFGSEKRASSTGAPPNRGSVSFSFPRRSSSHGPAERKKRKDDQMARWLEVGNVIYKSVGLGLMDLAVGMYLVQFAKEKGVGNHIEGF